MYQENSGTHTQTGLVRIPWGNRTNKIYIIIRGSLYNQRLNSPTVTSAGWIIRETSSFLVQDAGRLRAREWVTRPQSEAEDPQVPWES